MATSALNSSHLVTHMMDLYEQAMEYGDPRTKDWLFVKTPAPAVSAMFLYYLTVWLGPRLMRDRKPVDLSNILPVYNFALVVFSCYMTYEFFMCAYLASYSLGCQPVDYSDDPLALRMTRVCWFYYFSKYIELADTVFFILRKKTQQLTALHIYHHSTMVFIWWVNVRYIPGGPAFFHPLLNSFVHVIMYTYYGLAALGPAVQPYLWWKKYVTKIQLTQFFMVFVHCTYVTTQCDFPLGFSGAALLYDVSMLALFANFYYRAYLHKVKARSKRAGKEHVTHSVQNGRSHDSKIHNGDTSYSIGTGKLHSE